MSTSGLSGGPWLVQHAQRAVLLRLDGERVLWLSESGALRASHLSGRDHIEARAADASQDARITSFVAGPSHIFFISRDAEGDSLRCVTHDGRAEQILAHGAFSDHLAIYQDRLYWVDLGRRGLVAMPCSGGKPALLAPLSPANAGVHTRFEGEGLIAISGGYILWTSALAEPPQATPATDDPPSTQRSPVRPRLAIFRTPMDGGPTTVLVELPHGITDLSATNKAAVWTASFADEIGMRGVIETITLDGSQKTTALQVPDSNLRVAAAGNMAFILGLPSGWVYPLEIGIGPGEGRPLRARAIAAGRLALVYATETGDIEALAQGGAPEEIRASFRRTEAQAQRAEGRRERAVSGHETEGLDELRARQRQLRMEAANRAPLFPYSRPMFEPVRARRGGEIVSDLRAELTGLALSRRGACVLLAGAEGSGKSFILHEVSAELEARADAPVPLLIDVGAHLGDSRAALRGFGMDELIRGHLLRVGLEGPAARLVLEAVQRGDVALLLDHADRGSPRGFVPSAVARACAALPATSTVVVACRSAAFSTLSAREKVLAELSFDTRIADDLELEPFDRTQIWRALWRRAPEQAAARMALVDADPELSALVRIPFFLAALARLNDAHSSHPRSALMLADCLAEAAGEELSPFVRFITSGSSRPPAELLRTPFVTADETGAHSYFHPFLAEWMCAEAMTIPILRTDGRCELDGVMDEMSKERWAERTLRLFTGCVTRVRAPSVPRHLSEQERIEYERRTGLSAEARNDAVYVRFAATLHERLSAWARRAARPANPKATEAANARDILRALGGSPPAMEEGSGAEPALGPGLRIRYVDLQNRDLRGRDLTSSDLSFSNLAGADLRGAKLHGARLVGANLIGATLDDGALDGADTFGAALRLDTPPTETIVHNSPATAVSFHPNGLLVQTAHWDYSSKGAIQIWDHESGRCLRVQTTAEPVMQLVTSPDGRTLAGAGHSRLRMWDAATLTEKLAASLAYGRIAWSPTGLAFAAASVVGRVHLHDARTHRELRVLPDFCPAGAFVGVLWTDDDRIITSVGRTVRVWDANTGRELFAFSVPYNVEGLVRIPKSSTLVTASERGMVSFWEVGRDGATLRRSLADMGYVRELAPSPDGRFVALALQNRVGILDERRGELARTLAGGGYSEVLRVAWSPDSRLVAAGMLLEHSGGATMVWDAETGEAKTVLRAPSRAATSASFFAVGLAQLTAEEIERLPKAEAGATGAPRAPVTEEADGPPPEAVRCAVPPGEASDCTSGCALWSVRFRSSGDQSCGGLALRPNGDISVFGSLSADMAVGAPIGVLRASTWSEFWVTLGEDGTARSAKLTPCHLLTADSEGGLAGAFAFQSTIELQGSSIGSEGAQSYLLYRVDASGHLTFSKVVTETHYGRLFALRLDPFGRLVLGGYLGGAADFGGGACGDAEGQRNTGFLAWYDIRGQLARTMLFPGLDLLWYQPGPDGSTLVAGRYFGSADVAGTVLQTTGESGRFFAKYGLHGEKVFVRGFDDETYFDMAVGPEGHIYLAGTLGRGCDFGAGTLPAESAGKLFAVKLASDGTLLWQKWWESEGPAQSGPIALLPDGGLFLAGAFRGTLSLGTIPLRAAGTGRNSVPFAARLSAGGDAVWSRAYGDGELAYFTGAAVAEDGHVVACGVAAGDLDLGAGTMAGTGRPEVWVAKLTVGLTSPGKEVA